MFPPAPLTVHVPPWNGVELVDPAMPTLPTSELYQISGAFFLTLAWVKCAIASWLLSWLVTTRPASSIAGGKRPASPTKVHVAPVGDISAMTVLVTFQVNRKQTGKLAVVPATNFIAAP